MEKLVTRVINQLVLLRDFIENFDDLRYSAPDINLSGSSIGQHTRHIIEFYQILLEAAGKGYLNYDERNRDIYTETSVKTASEKIKEILIKISDISDPGKILIRTSCLNDSLESTFSRELLYVYEHGIHHMAILKMASLDPEIRLNIPSQFGIADSTLEYRALNS